MRDHNRALQLAPHNGYALARSTVTVCEWPDGRLAIEYRGRAISWTDVTGRVVASPPAPVIGPSGLRRVGRAPRRIIRGDKGTKASVPTSRSGRSRIDDEEPMEAAEAVDAKNAPTAPWKT